MNIKNAWMLGNFFHKSMDHKPRVTTKQKLPSTCQNI